MILLLPPLRLHCKFCAGVRLFGRLPWERSETRCKAGVDIESGTDSLRDAEVSPRQRTCLVLMMREPARNLFVFRSAAGNITSASSLSGAASGDTGDMRGAL